MQDIAAEIRALSATIWVERDVSKNVNKWRALIEQYRDLRELDETILNDLVDKIFVYEAETTYQQRRQNITIEYRFIGPIPS